MATNLYHMTREQIEGYFLYFKEALGVTDDVAARLVHSFVIGRAFTEISESLGHELTHALRAIGTDLFPRQMSLEVSTPRQYPAEVRLIDTVSVEATVKPE